MQKKKEESVEIPGIDHEILGRKYQYDQYGNLRQTDAKPYSYSRAYCEAQKTTTRLSHVRLGFALSILSYDFLRHGNHLEVGPGGGQFMTAMREAGLHIEGYDVVPTPFSTIDRERVSTISWSAVFLYDVLEHFVDIDELWELDFSFACVSFPERPQHDLLTAWRHLKPDEHRWHFSRASFIRWVESRGSSVLAMSDCEDAIRTRWDDSHPNICSAVIARRSSLQRGPVKGTFGGICGWPNKQ